MSRCTPSEVREARTTAELKLTRTTAPMMPPSSESSWPMTAFWTTLDSSSITTRSKEFSCARSRLPASRSSTASTR
jgi:hypothetical protein